jgi:hypothetical protein
MHARFKGGTWDGLWRQVPDGARRVVVAVQLPQTASAEDFSMINLDHVWNGRPPPPHNLKIVRDEDGIVSDLFYELEGE